MTFPTVIQCGSEEEVSVCGPGRKRAEPSGVIWWGCSICRDVGRVQELEREPSLATQGN